MKKLISATVALLALNLASFGQIQISGGGGTNKVTISVLQDITFKVNTGAEAWGYIWGVKIPDIVSSADGVNGTPTLLSGLGGVSNSANESPYAVAAPIIYSSNPYATVRNGIALEFIFNNDFKLVGGNTFTIRQGTYERPWAGSGIDPTPSFSVYPSNTLINSGTTYTITENSFYSFSETGSLLSSSNITLVPEPSALSLLAVGLGGLAMVRRRRS